MDLLDSEKALLKYLNEFRLRPSKVSAEFFYNSKTRDSWDMIEKTLFLWLDIFSEFDALPETSFKELFNLVKSLRSLDENNTADTSRVFFLLRTHARRLIVEKSELLEILVVNLSVKSLVCQLFIALMEDNVTNIYKSITLSLYEEDKVKMLRSVLSSLTKNHLMHLRNRLTDGHARADYTCPCHIGKVAQHLKMIGISLVTGRDEEDESPQCEVLLFLDEINSLLEVMDSPQFYTKAHELHKIADRQEFARHFEMKNKKQLAKEKLVLEEEEAEKEREKEAGTKVAT